MKDEYGMHPLKRFAKYLEATIDVILSKMEDGTFPSDPRYIEYPVKIRHNHVSLGVDTKHNTFYLHGKDSDGEYVHIMI